MLKAPSAELSQNACGVVNEQKIFCSHQCSLYQCLYVCIYIYIYILRIGPKFTLTTKINSLNLKKGIFDFTDPFKYKKRFMANTVKVNR